MEVYTLDIALRRSTVIDTYFEFIWTERFNEQGDFEMSVPPDIKFRSILAPGQLLAQSDSTRIMIVETLEEVVNQDGRRQLVAKGPSYESVLDQRVLAHPTERTWDFTSPPAGVARQMFDDICVDFILTPNDDADSIEWYSEGNLYPGDNIEETQEEITVSLPPTSLYKAIRDVCVEHGLGFRICRDGDNSHIFFNIYPGNDRSPKGPSAYPIIFSESLNNLQNISSLATIALEKNVVWVTSDLPPYRVIVESDSGGGIGLSRRQIVIAAEDLTDEMTEEEREEEMRRQGRKTLSICRPITAFDGEIDPNQNWKYDRDYYLGDIVGITGEKGQINYMRVTEQIFVSDANGYRTYPTLSIDTAADPYTWLAWGGQKEWDDLTDEQWGTIEGLGGSIVGG